jgi:iron complex outermembrane recepter protein
MRGLFGLITFFAFGSSHVLAQQSTAAEAPAEQIVVMPVFDVSTDRDKGYSSSQSIGATRMGMALKEIPQNIAVINENFIRDVAPRSISDIAQYVAGVSLASGLRSDRIAIRGVTVDQPASNGLADVGSSQGTGLDIALFNRIEILKGPTALIYGTTASGGVVNRTMKKPVFGRDFGSLELTVGSFSDHRTVLDINKSFGAKNQFAARFVGAYWDREGMEDFYFGRRKFFAPEFSWRIFEDTTLTLIYTDYWDKYYKGGARILFLPPIVGGRPSGFTTDLDYVPNTRAWANPDSRQREIAQRLNLELLHRVNDSWSLRLSGYTGWYAFYEDAYNLPRSVVDVGGELFLNRSYRDSRNPDEATVVALDSAWDFKIGPSRHKLVALAQYTDRENKRLQWLGRNASGNTTNALPLLSLRNPVFGALPFAISQTADTMAWSTNFGAAVQEQAYFLNERLIVQAGIRFDRSTTESLNRRTSVRNTPPARTAWTPRFGMVYSFSDSLTAYISRSETFAPIFNVNPDGSTFKPRTSEQDEIGLKFDGLEGKLSAVVAYYDRSDRNTLINHPDPALNSAGYRIQIPGDDQKGFEVDLLLAPVAGLQLMVGASKIDAELLSGFRPENVPTRTFTAFGSYTIRSGPIRGLKLGLGYIKFNERAGNSTNTYFMPGYDVWNAVATYAWGNNEIQVNFENLEDEFYMDNGGSSGIEPGAPGSIRVRFTRRF